MPFKPGVVHKHKPTGRPRGSTSIKTKLKAMTLEAMICHDTDQGREIVDYALTVFRKSKNQRMRWQAMEWLADRVWGRVPQVVQGDVAVTHSKLDLASLDGEQRSQLRAILEAARPRLTEHEEVEVGEGTSLLREVPE
jgi:hypothetical protein